MCGFFISNDPMVVSEHFRIVEENLRFRGPDGSSGMVTIGQWKSYHARLAIIDLDSGVNQPVINNDHSQLVFNGEILNYKELGKKYFDREYISDTYLLNDLIVNRLLDLNELDGFFSFVYINSIGEIEYACRDKFGVKPLFYFSRDDFVTFCSEPIVIQKIFKNPVNNLSLEEYKAFRSPIFEGSFFQGIKQVPPGECYANGAYFSAAKELADSNFSRNETDLCFALKAGIHSRCISDAPIGLLLSKGIDSNLIRVFGNFGKLYSIGFEGDEDIEFLKTVSIDGLTVHQIEKAEFLSEFYRLLQIRGEPLSVPNEVLLYVIAKKAKADGIKVLLSGEGADEFFGGYDRIFSWAESIDKFNLDEFISLYCYSPIEIGSRLFKKMERLFDESGQETVFDKVRWFFIRYHMPVLFRRLDFALMAAGVEGREPIANIHLFGVCKALTGQILMKNGVGKHPLRELLARYLGDQFAFEQKVGFPVDLTAIFEDERKLSSYELWFDKNLEILR
jgi:asparagine synthase (glutamine-hydrolysing)